MYPTTNQPDPATLTVWVWSENRNRFVAVRMTRLKCPECGANFDSMVWYNANRRNMHDPLWVVECECGEQFTSAEPE